MTVQELRDILADEKINNDAEVFVEMDGGSNAAMAVYVDDDGYLVISDDEDAE